MALAVDVRRERAADGDEARARRHRYEVAEREHDPHELIEACAGVDPHAAVLEVDVVDSRQRARVEHGSTGVLRRVAVAAAEPACDHAARPGTGEHGVDVSRLLDANQRGRGRCGPRPSRDQPEPGFGQVGLSHECRART